MSSYKVVLKPGGVGGRNVGVGIKLAKKPLLSPEEIAALSAVVPVSTSLEVTVIYPVGMIGASVQITGPDAFDQTIVNTMMFDAITAGDYIIVAAAVAGHTVRVFTSPKSVPQGGKTCAMVIYDLAGTGGGGDCTPTCPIDCIKFTPNLAEPSIGFNPITLDDIPDSDFTEFLQFDNTIFGNRLQVYGRFQGQICSNTTLAFTSSFAPNLGGNANGHVLQVVSLGARKTFVLFADVFNLNGGVAPNRFAGTVSAQIRHIRKVGGVAEDLCGSSNSTFNFPMISV